MTETGPHFTTWRPLQHEPFGPVELYELEDAALRARRVLGKAP